MNTAQDLIGRTFQGKFVITDILGEGAMGIVYRGFDDATLDEVAIKVLQPALAAHEELVLRFHREAAATRRVDHEGTVRVLGRGCEEGFYYLVMELLHGKCLGTVLAETGRMSEVRAARIVMQLCGALQVAHERGVVHRDIKPDNMMVIEGGDQLGERVKLLDFGIAKRLSSNVEDSFNSGCDTRHGALIGTPEYMAPEQCMGRDVDPRTDIYACGVLLYRMVTGQVPFDGTGAHPFELCQRHIGEEPEPPREICPWLRPEMEAIILKALSKSPEARQQTAAELSVELGRIVAAAAAIETEPTARLMIDDVVPAAQAALFAADLAAPVHSPELPTLVMDPPGAPAAAAPAPAAPVARAASSMPSSVFVSSPGPLPRIDLSSSISDEVVFPVPIPIVSEPTEHPDRPTLVTATIRRPRRSARRKAYLPTVALAAVIGAGLGSLFMALAPLIQR